MFFEVKAKCGHVGRNKYVIKDHYTQADSAKKAAYIIRYTPRVKHNHKDAIRQVKEISYEEYVAGIIKNKKDPYFNVHNSSDQKRFVTDLEIYEEKQNCDVRELSNLYYKLRKQKIIDTEYKRMVNIAIYG